MEKGHINTRHRWSKKLCCFGKKIGDIH
jgi:hypothetical protein